MSRIEPKRNTEPQPSAEPKPSEGKMIRRPSDTCAVSQDLSLLSFARRLLSFFDNRLFDFRSWASSAGNNQILGHRMAHRDCAASREFASVQWTAPKRSIALLTARSEVTTTHPAPCFRASRTITTIRVLSLAGIDDANSIAFCPDSRTGDIFIRARLTAVHVDTFAVSQDLSLLSFSRRFLSFFDNRLGFPFLGAPCRG